MLSGYVCEGYVAVGFYEMWLNMVFHRSVSDQQPVMFRFPLRKLLLGTDRVLVPDLGSPPTCARWADGAESVWSVGPRSVGSIGSSR